jgi:Phosphotransferase system sorbitol-specific component IIA
MLYRTQLTQIGEYAADALSDKMMILFNDNAPADVADYCFIHPAALTGEISVGGQFVLGAVSYPITRSAMWSTKTWANSDTLLSDLMAAVSPNTLAPYMLKGHALMNWRWEQNLSLKPNN